MKLAPNTRPARVYIAVIMLYMANLLGLFDLLTETQLMPIQPRDLWADFTVYTLLLILAFGISLGFRIFRLGYVICSVIWYISLIFLLSHIHGHPLNIGLVFIEVTLTIAAMCFLYQAPSKDWLHYKSLSYSSAN